MRDKLTELETIETTTTYHHRHQPTANWNNLKQSRQPFKNKHNRVDHNTQQLVTQVQTMQTQRRTSQHHKKQDNDRHLKTTSNLMQPETSQNIHNNPNQSIKMFRTTWTTWNSVDFWQQLRTMWTMKNKKWAWTTQDNRQNFSNRTQPRTKEKVKHIQQLTTI